LRIRSVRRVILGEISALAMALLLVLAGGCRSGGESGPLTFGLIADCQFANKPAAGTRFYSYSWLKLINSIEEFNRREVSFAVQLGDLIDGDAANFELILPLFNRAAFPFYGVIGNHDFDVEDELKPGLPARLGTGRGYYAFSKRSWRFIVLNGNELSFNSAAEGALRKETEEMFSLLTERKRASAAKWNGGIGEKQFDFLKAELERAEKAGQKIIVFCHFPVLPAAAHNLWNDQEVVSLLERYPGMKAYFSGHNHEGDYSLKNGIHYVTFKGMVETRDTNAAALITLTEHRITIHGLGRETSRDLDIR